MAKKKPEDMTEEERIRNREHALATKRFYILIVLLFLILALVISSVALWIATPRQEEPEKPPSTNGNMFAVETIMLEGNTRYLENSVIGESGILIGQSIFTVDSNKIEAHLLEIFPYYSAVEVQTLHMKDVCIRVTETDVVGVLYADGCWIPVGSNGKALDKQPITSDRPKNSLYIKGGIPEGGIAVGKPALEEYTASVLGTLLSAINQYQLADVTEIDLIDLTDIRLVWRGQIEVLLGNTTNLVHEVGVAAATIPKIIESRGAQVTGRLNLISYSNEALENQAIFTPASLLPTSTTAPRKPAAGEATTTTTTVQADDTQDEYYEDDYSEETGDSEEDSYYEEEYSEDDSYYEEEYSEDDSGYEDGSSEE